MFLSSKALVSFFIPPILPFAIRKSLSVDLHENTSDNSATKEYNSTKNYKPVGIYNSDIMQKIQDKFK